MKNIFFDLDGTLTDSRVGITRCIQHALEQLGLTAPDMGQLETYIGGPLQCGFADLLGTDDPATVDRAIELYRDRYRRVGIYENEVYAGVPGVLDAARQAGLRLFVVTAKPTPFAKIVLDHFDLRDYFQQVYGSELDGRFVEKTDLLRHVLAAEKIDPGDAVMIGDRRHDIVAAQGNGVASIAVRWGYAQPGELAECDPSSIVDAVSDLSAAISKLRADRPTK